ncbi:nuclear transport factor 2 family protein [Saccharicrinis sp. GN24d3]|uniref:nuclear transport factor 2 family protein n=1 Tax=Saccharicrinis sp. GN24d3 TaxID=3458416 RepID=UPI0040362B6F
MNPTIEQRIQRLEDLEAIKTLQYAYGQLVDKGWDGKEMITDGLEEVFTEDASWESKAQNISVQGIQQISDLFKMMDARSDLFIHSFSNPIIDLQGDKATAKWMLISPMTLGGGELQNMLASYNNDYVRTPEGWRIKALRLNPAYMPKG